MLDPWNTADLSDYRNAILHLNGDPDVPWSVKRSKITGWLAAPLAQSEGTMSALRASSVVASVLVGSGLYLWGVAAGRTVGVLAVLAALALGPLVLLSRILTFYPMVAAFFVVGAALATAGIVSGIPSTWRSRAWGWVWRCSPMSAGLVWAGPWRSRRCGRCGASDRGQALRWFLAPLAVSYLAARWSFPADAVSLEAQMDVRPLMYMYGSETPGACTTLGYGRRLRLGSDPALGLAGHDRVRHPAGAGADPGGLSAARGSWFAANNHMAPLVPVWLVSAAVTGLTLWRRPRALVAVAATVLPFAIAFHGQANLAEFGVRFLRRSCPVWPSSRASHWALWFRMCRRWGRTRWFGLRGVAVVVFSPSS